MKILLIFTLLTLQWRQLTAQNIYTITQSFNIESLGNRKFVTAEGFLPKTIHNRQRVIDIRFSDKRVKRYSIDGVEYFKFNVSALTNSTIQIIYDIELFDFDLEQARFKKIEPIKLDVNNLEKYLKKEPFQNINNKKLVAVAEKIEGSTDIEITHNIFDFVVEHLDYNNDIYENIGATRAYKKGLGDCTEYADLMVTLCRIKGIPARVVAGMVARSGTNPNHNWCEVYLMDYGWVPFDPTFADGSSYTEFEKLNNRYIYFNLERKDNRMGSSVNKWHYSGVDISIKPNYECNTDIKRAFSNAYSYYNNRIYDSALIELDKLLIFDNKNITFITFKAMILARHGMFNDAYTLFQLALVYSEHDYEKMNTYYSFANFLSLRGDYENTLKYLTYAIDLGFHDFEHLKTDQDLEGFRLSGFYQDLAPILIN